MKVYIKELKCNVFYRFSRKKTKEAIKKYLKTNRGVQLRIDFDDFYLVTGFAHPKLPIIKQASIELSEWGLIPAFVLNVEKAGEMQDMTLNARSDTAREKPSYKKSIQSQR